MWGLIRRVKGLFWQGVNPVRAVVPDISARRTREGAAQDPCPSMFW
jgi:hypothetical protein